MSGAPGLSRAVFGLVSSPRRGHFVGPYAKALQLIRPKRRRDGDVGRVAASCNQHAADAGSIVSRVEGVPMTAEIRLEPGGEVHRGVRRRQTDVTQVAGAVPRRNVQAAAESNGEMRKVAANSFA